MNYPNANRTQDLITKAILNKIPALYAQEGRGEDAIVYLKMYLGSFTWFFTEFNPETGILFGKTFSHMCPDGEYGYTQIEELQELLARGMFAVERDASWTPKPLKECGNPCRA